MLSLSTSQYTGQITIVGIIHSKILVTHLSVDPLQSTMHIISSLPCSPHFFTHGDLLPWSILDTFMHLGILSFGLPTYIEMCFPLTPPLLQSVTGKEREDAAATYTYIYIYRCACANARKVLIAMTFLTMIERMSHEITSLLTYIHVGLYLYLQLNLASSMYVSKLCHWSPEAWILL